MRKRDVSSSMVERRSPKPKVVGSMPTRPTFQLFSNRLPPVPKSGVVRCLNLIVWSDGRIWLDFINNRGRTCIRHITPDHAEKLIRNAGLVLIRPQERENG